MTEPFEQRRFDDPQGLIDDLVKQTTKQGRDIADKRRKIEELNTEIESLKKSKKKKARKP